MFCENCGQQINDGERFCPNCGAMVNGVVPIPNTYVQPQTKEKSKKPLLIVLLLIGFISLLAVIGLTIFFFSDTHKVSMQRKLAAKCMEDSDYEEAIKALKAALKLDRNNSSIKDELKTAYKEEIKQAIDDEDYDYAEELIEEANDFLDTSYFDKYLDDLLHTEEAAPEAEEAAPEAEEAAPEAEEAAPAAPAEEAYAIPSEEMLISVLDTILDWAGLQYFYEDKYNYSYLGELDMFQMAAWGGIS